MSKSWKKGESNCIDCTSLKECYRCDTKGCDKCVKVCCCDCCVSLCKRCRDSYDIKCGCYGDCAGCGREVDRGSDGWPCHKCDKWFCGKCRFTEKNDCKECNPDECGKCGQTSPPCVCAKCSVTGCQDCLRNFYHTKCGGYTLCRECYPNIDTIFCQDDKDCFKCCKQ
jgi:hypothetical protein